MASVTEALKVLDRGVHALPGLSAVQDNSEGLHLPATFWRAMRLTEAMNRPHFRRHLEGLLVADNCPSRMLVNGRLLLAVIIAARNIFGPSIYSFAHSW